MLDIAANTIVPFLILISLGILAKKKSIFKEGEEKVLSEYIYYFGLPSYFITTLSNFEISKITFNFIIAILLPTSIYLFFLFIVLLLTKKIELFYKITISSIFGSTVFFGIPFIIFAFPEGEYPELAVIMSSILGSLGLTISILFFEVYSSNESSNLTKLRKVIKKTILNPLILSVLIGFFISFTKFHIWKPIAITLKILGTSIAPTAIIMLGAFLYGKKYTNLKRAFYISQIRFLILPLIALFTAKFFQLKDSETIISVLLHATPLAIAVAVLSQKYHLEEDNVSNVILVTSIGAIFYLNMWILILKFWLI